MTDRPASFKEARARAAEEAKTHFADEGAERAATKAAAADLLAEWLEPTAGWFLGELESVDPAHVTRVIVVTGGPWENGTRLAVHQDARWERFGAHMLVRVQDVCAVLGPFLKTDTGGLP